MEITKDGIKLHTYEDIVSSIEAELQKSFGAEFKIKPGGMLDSIVSMVADIELEYQTNLENLALQYQPEKAEGTWQDSLYERMGAYRLSAQPTTFTKSVVGAADYTVPAGSVTIRTAEGSNDFTNISEFTTDKSGKAYVDFSSIEPGDIPITETEEFLLLSAPEGIDGVGDEEITKISQGRSRESDEDYRIRFRNSKALNSRATRNANIANLTKYVDDVDFLSIIDKNEDLTMSPGTLLIIAKHNTTDNIFARAIFDTVGVGVVYQGDTCISLKDECGEDVQVKFKNALEIPVEIKSEIKIRSGYYSESVFADIRKNISEYIDKRVFGLGVIIYATEFIIPILETEGVEAVSSISIKRDGEEDYTDNLSMERDEVPEFTESGMNFVVSD